MKIKGHNLAMALFNAIATNKELKNLGFSSDPEGRSYLYGLTWRCGGSSINDVFLSIDTPTYPFEGPIRRTYCINLRLGGCRRKGCRSMRLEIKHASNLQQREEYLELDMSTLVQKAKDLVEQAKAAEKSRNEHATLEKQKLLKWEQAAIDTRSRLARYLPALKNISLVLEQTETSKSVNITMGQHIYAKIVVEKDGRLTVTNTHKQLWFIPSLCCAIGEAVGQHPTGQ